MTSELRKTLVRLTRVVALLAIFGLATTHLLAQSIVSGDITGTVTDPTGAVIAKAAVTLKSLDRGETQVTNTNESGFYRFSLLKPGRYAVSISHGGFRGEQRSVDVNVGQSTSANFVLQMGQATEVLEVTAEAPLVNSDSANVSTSYDLR